MEHLVWIGFRAFCRVEPLDPDAHPLLSAQRRVAAVGARLAFQPPVGFGRGPGARSSAGSAR